jgi:hypothetical protein
MAESARGAILRGRTDVSPFGLYYVSSSQSRFRTVKAVR